MKRKYQNKFLRKPVIPKFERKGFVVTEWGIILQELKV